MSSNRRGQAAFQCGSCGTSGPVMGFRYGIVGSGTNANLLCYTVTVAVASIIESSWKCRKPAARAVEAEVEAEVAAGHLFGLVRNLQILSVEFNQWKPSSLFFLFYYLR